jgi:hypothetical protein
MIPVMVLIFSRSNEPVGKVLLTSENDVFGGHLSPPKYKIVECGASCEVIFSTSHQRICLGTFSTASTMKLTGSRVIGDPVKRVVMLSYPGPQDTFVVVPYNRNSQ